MEYRFFAKIRNQSEFFLNTEALSAGTFAVLSCTNVTDVSKIKLTAKTEGILPTPVFHRDGDLVRALLVIPEYVEAQECSFTVSYGASEQTFTLTVHPSASAITEADLQALSPLLSTLTTRSGGLFYFRGNFLDPKDQGYTLGIRHGEQVTEEDAEPWTCVGTEYFAPNGEKSRVSALNHGIVTLTGHHEQLGNYVVVDHGGGLRTWYCHLSGQSVQVGNVVQKGELLGWTGNGASGEQMLLLATVYQSFIDPAFLIGNEIQFDS
jgi:hypothetical protein